MIKANFRKFFDSVETKSEGFFFSARIKIFVILLSTVDHLSHFFILFFHSQVTQTFYKLRADPEQKHKSLKVHLEKDYPAWESPKPLPHL